MASAPSQSGQAPPPSQAGAPHTAEWGAAVHGSSAFLQTTYSGYPATGGAAPQPIQSQHPWQATSHASSYSVEPHGVNAMYSSSCPGNGSIGPYGYTQQHQAWDQTQPYSYHAASGSLPARAPWQESSGHPPQHPPFINHTQHYHYSYAQPQQHEQGQQCGYTQQDPDRQLHASWQSYHCHSSLQSPAAVDGGGDGAPWHGWSSYNGGVQSYKGGGPPTDLRPDLGPSGAAASSSSGLGGAGPYGQQPSSNHMYHLQQQQQQQQPQQQQHLATGSRIPTCGPSTVEPASCTTGPDINPNAAAAGVDIRNDEYDPMADVEAATGGPSAAPAAAAATAAPDPWQPLQQTAAPRGSVLAAERDKSAAENHHSSDNTGPGGGATLARAAAAAAAAPPAVDLVAVWDLDETLIVFNSLLSGAFAAAAAKAEAAAAGAAALAQAPGCATDASGARPGGVQSEQSAALGRQLAEMVFSFCDDHLAFNKFEEMDPVSFLELWSATAAAATSTVDRATLERIAKVYGGGAAGLDDVIGEAGCRTRGSMLAEAERLTGGWVAAARRLLAGVTTAAAASMAMASAAAQQPVVLSFRSVRHVLVSAGHLVATLGKLVLWGLDDHFDIRDVYSASGRPKLEIFRALRARFGPTVAYAAVGDGTEEERAAAVMGWGFVRVGLVEAVPGTLPGAGAGAMVPWRIPRPLVSIRPEDVLEAARAAY